MGIAARGQRSIERPAARERRRPRPGGGAGDAACRCPRHNGGVAAHHSRVGVPRANMHHMPAMPKAVGQVVGNILIQEERHPLGSCIWTATRSSMSARWSL